MFDAFALIYYEETVAEETRKQLEEMKRNRDGSSGDSRPPMSFDAFQELLEHARENAESGGADAD